MGLTLHFPIFFKKIYKSIYKAYPLKNIEIPNKKAQGNHHIYIHTHCAESLLCHVILHGLVVEKL